MVEEVQVYQSEVGLLSGGSEGVQEQDKQVGGRVVEQRGANFELIDSQGRSGGEVRRSSILEIVFIFRVGVVPEHKQAERGVGGS